MPEPILAVSGLHAGYGTTEILRGVDLTVRQGEIVALLGANGAGKSSLLNAVVGLVPIAGGPLGQQEVMTVSFPYR